MEKIFSVTAVSVETVTEEIMQQEYEIYLAKYKNNISYETFLEFKKSWKEDKYNIESFVSSYHLDKQEAEEYIKNNIGDINEAGCYNYAVLSDIPVGCSYYNSEQNRNTDFAVYQYNSEKDLYEPLPKDAPEYDYILRHVWGYI